MPAMASGAGLAMEEKPQALTPASPVKHSSGLAILVVLGGVGGDLLLALTVVERGGFAALLHDHLCAAIERGKVGLERFAQIAAIFRGIGDRLGRRLGR